MKKQQCKWHGGKGSVGRLEWVEHIYMIGIFLGAIYLVYLA